MLGNGRCGGPITGRTAAALMIGGAALGLALAGCAAGQGPAAAQSPAQQTTAQQTAAQQTAAQQTAAQQTAAPQATVSRAASGATASGETSAAAKVPWQSVGQGWVLDTYSTGTYAKPAPTTLYLVSPAGAKYALLTWPASASSTPTLDAWAGDKTEALFWLYSPSGQQDGYGELNLMTATMTRVAFPSADTSPLGYTLPDGQQILGVTQRDLNSTATIARYTQAGALVQTLVSGPDATSAVYSPDGTALAVPAPGGLQLVSNAGGVLRNLPVPGVTSKNSCGPVRWWDATTILANCDGLWLVPSGGAKPTELTPVRKASSFDLGDIDAWQLPSGLYLQSLGACGTLELNKQASDGSVTAVSVPGMAPSPVVVTASGARLLIAAQGCHPGFKLAWYNPGSGAEQWIFTSGSQATVAYNDPDNATRS